MYGVFELGCVQVCMCMHTHTHVPRHMEPRGQWCELPKALSACYLLASHLPTWFLFSMHVPTIAIFQEWDSQEKPEQSRCQCMLSGSTFLCNLSCLGCFIIAMNNSWITFCLMALLMLLLLFRDRVSFCRSDWPEIYQLSLRASAPVCLWDYRLEPLCLTIGFPYCWHWRTLRMFWVVVHFFFLIL